MNTSGDSKLNSIPKLGYIPALDGLRAVAVMLVLLTHASFQLGDNGVLGVDIFFTLSGFLITTLLLEENEKFGNISLRAFYVRRFFRLFPALYTMLFFVLLYALAFRRGNDLNTIIGEITFSALYLNNISWMLGGGDILLGHTWSLAVEEQFYLLWPLTLLLGISFKSIRALIFGLVFFISACVILKLSGRMSGIAVSLIYESVFIGCLAALFRWQIGSKIIILDHLALLLILIVIIVGILPINWYMMIYNAGGRSLMGLITSLVILSIVNNRKGITSKLLSISPLVWVGKISYALYLWHVPVFRIFRYHSTLPPAISFILKFLVTFFLATLSWNLIERKSTILGRSISKRIMLN